MEDGFAGQRKGKDKKKSKYVKHFHSEAQNELRKVSQNQKEEPCISPKGPFRVSEYLKRMLGRKGLDQIWVRQMENRLERRI